MKTVREGDFLVAFPKGRITADNANVLEADLNRLMRDSNNRIMVDIDAVEYISSAGLRVFHKISKSMETPLIVRNASPEVYDIFEITGFTEILDIRKKMRSISLEGCQVIGQGTFGKVYRIDDETIVKVYESPEYLPLIQLERKRARQAFIRGIPTAIPYDIVRVGDSYGSVFELLRARNLNSVFIECPDRADELLEKYVALLRNLHSLEMPADELPDSRDIFLGYIDELKDVLPPHISDALKKLLTGMLKCLRVVHGDTQMKNVMISGDELILIDMETLSVGNPVFDLQALYVTYRAYNEGDPHNSMDFLGITPEQSAWIWRRILELYFRDYSPDMIREMENRICVAACVRFLDRVATHGITSPEMREYRIQYAVERLNELLPRVTSLEI